VRVTYERLFNLGNYNNERIALEDEVGSDETPLEAYQRLRAAVYEMAGKPDPAAPKPTPAALPPVAAGELDF
jgi:hypothetical protein